MKFKKTALFLAVSAIASVSIAHMSADLTVEGTNSSEVLNQQVPENAMDFSSSTALETIAPEVPVVATTPEIDAPVVATAPEIDSIQKAVADADTAVTPIIATVEPKSDSEITLAENPPALTLEKSLAMSLPPPPPGINSIVKKDKAVARGPVKDTVVTQTIVDTSITSQSDSASTVRADKSGVAMSSDVLFSFSNHKINPAAKAMLDRLVPRLKAMDLEIILATGHADKIGSDAINQKIGLQRASAVRDYLIKSGIAATKIKVESKGSSESVAVDCDSKKGTLLRDCLAPDRRVNVVAQGFGTAGNMTAPVDQKASTKSTSQISSATTFTVFFEGASIQLKSTDNDLLDEVADAAMEADKVHLRGRSAIGDSEQRKARAIARGWAVRQGLVFRGVEKEDIRIFYRTKGLNPSENNERVDVELLPKVATSK